MGGRVLDTKIYNRDRKYSETEQYDTLYNTLQCIEYDYVANRCIVYKLNCNKDHTLEVMGMD
jgi:hypothetical protein